MKLKYILLGILLLALALEIAEAARSRSRTRNRSRSRTRGRRRRANCHMKAMDRCLRKVEKLSNDENASVHITTNEGLDKICSATKSVVRCMKGYMKKCGTPLQREMFDFMNEGFTTSVNGWCNNQTKRDAFLKESPCMHEKVLSTDEYQSKCVTPFLAALDKTSDKSLESADDRLDLSCCGYNRWEGCLYGEIKTGCGVAAYDQIQEFLSGAFAGQTKLICTEAAFPISEPICTKQFPPPGTKAKGKLSENPLTRYISNYFGFLF